MLVYYEIMLILSILLSGVYVYIWHKHFDVHITLSFLLLPIGNLAYVIVARAADLEAALVGVKLIYLVASFSVLFIVLAAFNLCHMKVKRSVRLLLVTITLLVYSSTLTIGKSKLFYRTAALTTRNGISIVTDKEYGFMHTIYYIMLIAYFAVCLFVLIYGSRKKTEVSRKILLMVLFPLSASIIAFFVGRFVADTLELMPAAYVLDQFFYILIAYNVTLYDIEDSGVDSILERGETGFVSFDFKFRYLGSNETARKFLPVLNDLCVDKPVKDVPELKNNVYKWLSLYKNNDSRNCFHYDSPDGKRVYQIDISYLYDGRRRRGYQFYVTDDTGDMEYIALLDKFNSTLERQVREKTEKIVSMHDKLIVSMASMVESRDNSTGGHINRTSEGVRILVDEMRHCDHHNHHHTLSDSFCKKVVKAAPMHDLGKIAVDDAILRKPGRFTPEEFEQMKKHAAEGARIVDQILKDTDDDEFHRIAVNVAHYHHERWDGSGYPEKLMGEQIPLEARIMAIADVYDALVSKRVYKESMPFDKADEIIMEGMGSQFDPGLKECYCAARPKLEEYYRNKIK